MTTTSSFARSLRPLLVGVVSVPLLGLLGACSSASDPGGDAAGPASGGAAETAAAVQDVAPLDAYLGAGIKADGSSKNTIDMLPFEEAVARCMADEGFEYVPQDYSWGATDMGDGRQAMEIEGGDSTFPDLPPDEFAARYGYGHSTVPKAEQEDPIDLNQKIIDKMSVAQRVAYYRALHGPGVLLSSSGYLDGEFESSDDSCSGQAARSTPTDAEIESEGKRVERVLTSFASLVRRIEELRDQEVADPRMVSATQDWSGCLAASGFPGFKDLEAPLQRSLEAARAVLGPDLDSAGADPAKLAAVRQDEIRLAVADQQCRIAYDETFATVQRDLEEQFVRTNVKELERFRSAMSAARR